MWGHVLLQAGSALPPLTFEIALVFAIILAALVLFVTEPLPLDIVAIGVLVSLIVLEPWTQIDPLTGLSGFASPATITVLAMFVLSDGIRRSGLVNRIGRWIADRFGDDPHKQLLSVLGLSGGSAGFINNTPVVAVLIPMVDTLAKKTGISPSKLLMPISYAAMLGGMLTVIGTSTNILASDVSRRVLDRPFSMFEFTHLGALVLVVGVVYLATLGQRLLPERIQQTDRLMDEFEMAQYLTEVLVREDSRSVGRRVGEAFQELDVDVDVLEIVRGEEEITQNVGRERLQAGDLLVLRTDQESLLAFIEAEGVDVAPDPELPSDQVDPREPPSVDTPPQHVVEVVISPQASILGRSLDSMNFRQRYDANVLAIRRGTEVIHARMDQHRLRGGDTLLVLATPETVQRFANDQDFILAQELTLPDYRSERLPVAVGIVVAVVALAGLGVVDIVVAALGGMVAMVATGCVKPEEVYGSVDWSVIFLLAGLIPLGVAMERTGAAAWLASIVVHYGVALSPIVMLGVFYLFTALITEVVSNNASVVLMIPVAVDAANAIGADPFSFVLAVTFAASTAMLTPIGYQTNVMVYAPGGYKFTDYFRVGAPLQAMLVVVTTLGIAFFWGV